MNKFSIGLYIENTWGNPTSKNYISTDARKEVLEWVVELFATQEKPKLAGCKYPDFEGGIEIGLHDLDKDNFCNICGMKIE